jgi:hypothetical protein
MIKTIIGLTTGIGVGQVVTNIVEATTPNNLSKVKKITTIVGGMAVSAVLSNLASEYAEEQFDSIRNTFNTLTKKQEEVQSE